jgi:serine protease Do
MRAAVTLVAALALAAALPAREPPTKDALLVAIEKQLRAAAESAGPSVGCVVASRSDRYPKAPGPDVPGKLGAFDLNEFVRLNTAPGDARVAAELDLSGPRAVANHGFACGVVVDPAGLILTPYHVVEGAAKVYVYLPGKPGSYADIHAADARHDLAVLKLINPPPGLTAIKFADVRLDTGPGRKPTVAAGSLAVTVAHAPTTGFTLDKPSAALGVVAAIRVPAPVPAPPPNVPPTPASRSESYYLYGTMVEIDARLTAAADGSRLSLGTDGAAVLDLDGQMIGLTTAAAALPGGDRGPQYAFPADASFRRAVDVLKRGEEVEYGYLGISMGNGLQIQTVVPRGPAARAGIQAPAFGGDGDTVTRANDVPIATFEELLHHVGGVLAGNKVKLTVARDGRSRDVEVTLGKYQHKQTVIASSRPDPVFGLRVDYGGPLLFMGLQPLAPELPDGVSVREIAPNSPAANAFKRLGDRPERWLITHVGGAPVAAPAEFYKAAKGQASVKLTVRDPSEQNPRDREVTIP